MDNLWTWIGLLLGRLHVLMVHFPIGMLVIALFLEGLSIGGKRHGLREGINWMVYLGTLFAIISTLLGWLLASLDDYTGELVLFHRNAGCSTAILASLTTLILRATLKAKLPNYLLYRFALFITVLSLVITGHLGAQLTHGKGYLVGAPPGNDNLYDENKSIALLSQLDRSDSLSSSELENLNLEVRAILAHNCYQCHNENKQKGELVLDTKRGVFQGGKSGPVIVSGDPTKSELYRRISLSANHKEVMPQKGDVLKNHELAIIKLWIQKGAQWSDRPINLFSEAPLALSKPRLPEAIGIKHPVDQILNNYFEKNDLKWPQIVDDHLFVRRAYLDIIGLLPPPEKINQFTNDQSKQKREDLIDELLNDHINYSQHWLSFWNDLLRNDYSGTGFITGGREQITDWLYASLMENKPYDELVSELVNPSDASDGFIKGIQWRGVINASQRIEMQAAQNIGQSLLGVNIKCASCHNSFVDNLTLEQAYGFASIFADSSLEINRCDKPLGKKVEPSFIYSQLGSVEAPTVEERLIKLSEIIIKPQNGRLYRTITNRIWKRLLGRGIIEPVDEMDQPPWDTSLLDWLAADFIESGYDLKHLIRMVMTSKTYQLPTINYEMLEEVKSSQYVFYGPLVRRLSAEQFTDAISQVIAPAFYAAAFNPTHEGLSANRVWHPEEKFDRAVLPEPGIRYFRHTFDLGASRIQSADVLISVDHAYSLFINGQQVAEGANWRKVKRLEVNDIIVSGMNCIAIKGTNEGKVANPAGILFAIKLIDKKGNETLLQSGKDWKSTEETPDENWINVDFDDDSWGNVRNSGARHWDELFDFTFNDRNNEFVRASLVRQHPFLKILGRPSRENVATTREDQATLLQALELTNGDFLNNVLNEGAEQWLENQGNNMEYLVQTLYQKSIGRKPTRQEKKLIYPILGSEPTKAALQDLFWSIILSPEFQFIY